METLFQDLRYGVRMLLKSPGFTAVAVLTIALGIGATTAIFSVVNAILLRPLPYKEPDRLVKLWEVHKSNGSRITVSIPNFLDWKNENQSFVEMAAFGWKELTLTGGFDVHGHHVLASITWINRLDAPETLNE